jgi:anti-sigma B factor antagonist
MKTADPTLMVSIAGSAVIVKVSGRATFNSSLDFKTLIQELRTRGFKRFLLDLGDCLVMDSTFLGVLAGLGQKIAASQNNGESPRMQLLCPNQRVSELLENLGVSHLFQVVDHTSPCAQEFATVQLGGHSREEITKTCLEAHQTLMNINPANVPKFKEVTRFLAEDLEKLKAGNAV